MMLEEEEYRNQQAKINKSKKNKMNKSIKFITYFMFLIFAVMVGFYVRFLLTEGEKYANNTYNPRHTDRSDFVIRGDIKSADGVVLATTRVDENGKEQRYYEYPTMFAHAVGYSTRGRTGVEEIADSYLSDSNVVITDQIESKLTESKVQGDSVTITIDYKLQESAYNMMSLWDGAFIAIEPSTGEIKAMISKPDFNVNSIAEQYDNMVADTSNSSLLNRCTQGLYPPGSTFKVLTTLAYLDSGHSASDFSFNCNGSISVLNDTFRCYGGSKHGQENLDKAFYKSCNCAYGTLGLSLNPASYRNTVERLYLNNDIPTDLYNVKKSSFTLDATTTDDIKAQTGFGQGETLVTPLQMAFIAAAICNDGVAMKPYIVKEVDSDDGYIVKNNKPTSIGQIIPRENAAVLQRLMRECVTDGTGSKLKEGVGYEAYGKTGTAEFSNNSDLAHSWFMGYAKGYNGKELAVAVIMEKAGNASYAAVPICEQVFNAYFSGL